jgi:uncharacterized protein YndB with AHSA1/START domain
MTSIRKNINLRKFLLAGLALLPLGSAPHANARAKSQATILIQAPLERIWSLVTVVDNWPQWNKAVKSAHLEGGIRPGAVFRWRSGGFNVTSTFQEIDPMTRLTWTGVAFGTDAIHSWTFTPTSRGVQVTTTETFDGWLPTVLPGAMQKTLDDTLPALLASLKVAAERPS